MVLISIAIGIACTYPVDLVQFFEGYRGPGPLAQRARAARMLHHSRRAKVLMSGPGPWATLSCKGQPAKNVALIKRPEWHSFLSEMKLTGWLTGIRMGIREHVTT